MARGETLRVDGAGFSLLKTTLTPERRAHTSGSGELLAHTPRRRIAIVAHGFLNRALAACLMSCDENTVMDIRQANDVVMRVRVDASGVRTADHFITGAGPHAGLPGAASPLATT